ncbi:MAG: restriction endonuclease subunit S [Elusimicrobiaceae bacterium]|nr:restriction endonuclease subunit S [Elusimicrobiaceae bacterium]
MQKSDWKKCKLEDICTIKKRSISPEVGMRYTLYSLPAFDMEKTPEYVKGEDIKSNKLLVEPNAILYNKLNIKFKRVWKLGSSLKENTICSTEFLPIYANKIEQAFLFYILTSPFFTDAMIGCATGTSNSHQRIQSSNVLNYDILLPPVEEQKRIAGILGALDDKIELLQKQNKTLEDMAKAIFKSWFVDFDVVHAKQKGLPKADIIREYHLTDELYDLFPSDFENSSLGLIPLGWQVKTLGDISTCYDSKRIPLSNRERAERQGNYPYYGATSIMDHVDDFLFDGIYLLLGEDGSVVKPEGTPFLQYVFGKIWVNNHAHVLQGKAPVGTEFLYLFLSDVQIQPYVTGAVQAKLNQKNMNSIPVCMATEDFVRQFQGIIEIYFVKIRSNLKQIQTLTELRDTLLPPLISGKIRV